MEDGGPLFRIVWVLWGGVPAMMGAKPPANTRRWPNIKPPFFQRLVFAGPRQDWRGRGD